ncbi:MAG: PAS domain S-box protein, partial [Arenibacter latericius]|nr:PAS domain S-box protein [Arenibacter latericius]
KLKSLQNGLRFLFYSSLLPKFFLDRTTYKILEVNDSMVNHFGYSRKDLIGMEVKKLFPKDGDSIFTNAGVNYNSPTETKNFGVFTLQSKSRKLSQLELIGHQLTLEDRNGILVCCNDVTEREIFTHRQIQSERRLKKATQIAKLGYWSVDLNNYAMTWSEEACRLWGVSKQEFVLNYENFINTVHPDDRNMFDKIRVSSLFKNRETDELTYRIILPNGAIKWIYEIVQLVPGKNGSAGILEGTVQDVTDQKNEEQHLRLLESVVTHTKEAVMIIEAEQFDESGRRIIYVNQAFVHMSGFTENEVLGRTTSLFFSLNTNAKEVNRIEKLLDCGKPFEVTLLSKKNLGHGYWVNLVANPVVDEDGKHTHWVTIGRDVTDKLKADKELKFINERFARVAQATTDVIWDWDITEKKLYLSDRFKSIFGHEVKLEGENIQFWEDLLHLEDKKRVLDSFYSTIKDPITNSWESEYRFLKSTGEYAYVLDKGTIIRDQDGNAIRIIGAMTDISLRKSYQNSLVQLNRKLLDHSKNIQAQNKKLKDIAWTQSHVVRAPLARLMGLITVINDEEISQETKKDLLNHIYTSAIELDVIIKDIVTKSQSIIEEDQ